MIINENYNSVRTKYGTDFADKLSRIQPKYLNFAAKIVYAYMNPMSNKAENAKGAKKLISYGQLNLFNPNAVNHNDGVAEQKKMEDPFTVIYRLIKRWNRFVAPFYKKDINNLNVNEIIEALSKYFHQYPFAKKTLSQNLKFHDGKQRIIEITDIKQIRNFIKTDWCITQSEMFNKYMRIYKLYLVDTGINDNRISFNILLINRKTGNKAYWDGDNMKVDDISKFETQFSKPMLERIDELVELVGLKAESLVHYKTLAQYIFEEYL